MRAYRFRLGGAILTLLLHATLLLSLVRITGSAAAPPPKLENHPPAPHLHAHATVDVLLIPGDGKGGIHQPCTGREYVGIGILLSSKTDSILMIGDNTPASRSGLRVGDDVLNREALREMKVGQLIRLVISRDGSEFPLELRAATICND